MKNQIIKEIIELAFAKAKEVIANPKKRSICEEISRALQQEYDISITYRTIERVHDKYVLARGKGQPSNETINYLCIYLGYKDYSDFIKKRSKLKNTTNVLESEGKNGSIKTHFLKKTFFFIISILVIISVFFFNSYRLTTITTHQNKNILLLSYLNNGSKKKLGTLTKENDHTLKIWLKTGEIKLYYFDFIEDSDQEYPGTDTVEIMPFWISINPIVLSKI